MRRVLLVACAVAVLMVVAGLVRVFLTNDASSPVVAPGGVAADAVAQSPQSGSTAATAAVDPELGSSAIAASNADADAAAAARAAGVEAVARTREVFGAGAISRRDLIADFTTASFAPQLAERSSQQVIDLLFGLRRAGGRAVEVQMISQPVTAQATAAGRDRVRVDVWTVSVFVADGYSPPPERWSTVHLDMVFEEGRWLVDGWEASPGPSPAPAPEGVFATDEEVAAVLAWPTAAVEGE